MRSREPVPDKAAERLGCNASRGGVDTAEG